MNQTITTKDYLFVGLALLIAAVVAAIMTPLVKKFAFLVGAVDVPKDQRRMHHKPIPRLGGLAIFIAFSVSVLILHSVYDKMVVEWPYIGIAIGGAIIVLLGIIDDIKALPAIPKFFVQLLAAGVAAYFGCRIIRISNPIISSSATYLELPKWLSFVGSVVWIVAITNAVNFIDGLDGLASGISAISAGSLMVIAALTGNIPVAIIMAAIMGGCLGFLPYNFNPAKIFMGDTGATFLGFILATMSIQGMFKLYAFVSFAVPVLILGVPIFDICFAFLRRVAKGQNPMTADRGHIHHRLIDIGFSQKQAVAIAYMMTAILGLTAIVLTLDGEMQALLLIAAFVLAGAVGIIIIMRSNFENETPQEKKDDKKD
ncbi:MAG: undecaprenyl/decaprenyl-phosphate alpha-N-acetylglucosaminyl 1-phosphate transferase [Clostridia bacterium]|nr:undecaprenyl/decaprenyl-phosphate alpha-N-acetylglucosaminyl 1-phosphate transferase [Clostridia bacterium]